MSLDSIPKLPAPLCGTVTVTCLFVPTSSVAGLLVSTLAGLKSYLSVWNTVRGFGLVKVDPSFNSRTSESSLSRLSIFLMVSVSWAVWVVTEHTRTRMGGQIFFRGDARRGTNLRAFCSSCLLHCYLILETKKDTESGQTDRQGIDHNTQTPNHFRKR